LSIVEGSQMNFVISIPRIGGNGLYRSQGMLQSRIWLRWWYGLTFEAASDILQIFNMSTTMARQGGWVHLEQSDMFLALKMATMANRGCLWATIEEMHKLIKKPQGDVRAEMLRGVLFPGHHMVKVAIEPHWQWFRITKPMAALNAKFAPQRIHHHAGGT
jgi:hypothetical protein